MKVVSYDIVFQEVPDEVTLALNISGCPFRCPGCHSKHLWQDIGEPLTPALLDGLLEQYGKAVTCVCFMGGDQDPATVMNCAREVRRHHLKTAWYSGADHLPSAVDTAPLDFLKIGHYSEDKGGLKNKNTNQRFFRRNADNGWDDCTSLFWKKQIPGLPNT